MRVLSSCVECACRWTGSGLQGELRGSTHRRVAQVWTGRARAETLRWTRSVVVRSGGEGAGLWTWAQSLGEVVAAAPCAGDAVMAGVEASSKAAPRPICIPNLLCVWCSIR